MSFCAVADEDDDDDAFDVVCMPMRHIGESGNDFSIFVSLIVVPVLALVAFVLSFTATVCRFSVVLAHFYSLNCNNLVIAFFVVV